jgi:hypothetical protein
VTNEELEQKYIHLFECMDGIPIRGIETGNGWSRIVGLFLDRLDWINTHNLHLKNDSYADWGIKIFQIKEKFGQLRIYANYPKLIEHQVEHLIGFVTGQAELTCEACGTVELIEPTKGWIVYYCQNCKDKHDRK